MSSGDPERIGSTVSVGLRRVKGLDLDAPLPDSDPGLLARIVAEIRVQGPMTFARFMELALYDPEAGYYTAQPRPGLATGPGRVADFLTAPEGHAIFGWAVARQLTEVWARLDRPARFVIREHGAGSGALAHGILDGLRRSGSDLFGAIRYQAVEVSPIRLSMLRDRLEEAGLASHLEPADERTFAGAILANELFDALPVHRVEGAPADEPGRPLRERFVDVDDGGELVTTPGEPSTPALAARLAAEGIELAPGQAAEICLAIDAWFPDATAHLERGGVLLIDYGASATELYAPTRGSTLRAYHRHRVHGDPLVAIGRQDLTAHVDLTAVERAAVAAGLRPIGRTTQAAFLAKLGLGELLVGLQSDPATTLETYLEARSAVARMLDPRATGAFAVLAFGRGLAAEVPLEGFS
jgi:SAM-dependent MidA family methyltransferase